MTAEGRRDVEVLIPTFTRQHALAVTLAGLAGQRDVDFGVIVSSQDREDDGWAPEVRAVGRILEALDRPTVFLRHLPRQGVAEHREFLFERSRARYVLFLDDDIWLEPDAVANLLGTIRREGCGFVGAAPHGPSHLRDHRPAEEAIEFWNGPVRPETVRPGDAAWQRHRLHNAANLLHVQHRLDAQPGDVRPYRVAWVGGCVLFDADILRDAGGFGFWPDLPVASSGEDVLAELRVMERAGGCAIVPSGAYHLELPTTIPERTVDAAHSIAV